ncbi:HAMP domain-containing histidine kinase [Streptacidiphilus sp. ASG 303]|uniref:sensor histidine kinase n=1 Tax=Streptacidiphilus sp. ASG 303 TaxID=2896847 RepID=UPI001E656191|nr:HAMP domain-containing sensor histidine kinase [Streptacidiphilus sp. ASG 303]MCD0485281.1 HAMP domain-containing histidine kinase [Streptacidiphilus sp. ASG 303]
MRLSLAARVAVAVGVTVPLLVLAAGGLLLRLVDRDLDRQRDGDLRARAAAAAPLARGLLAAQLDGRPRAERTRQRLLFSAALDVGVQVADRSGAVVAEGGPTPPAGTPLPGVAGVPVTVRADGESWRALALPVGGAAGGTLRLFSPDSARQARIRAVRSRVVLAALVAAPLAAGAGLLVARRAVRPLRLLQRRTSGLDPRTSTARPPHAPTRVAEVDDLARTLHTVLARYDEQAGRTAEALATARSFSAAASHELRTPLMSMQTNLEVLSAHPHLDPADREEILGDLRTEHARLLGLLLTLRGLAQGDLVEADAFGPVDLALLVRSCVRDTARRRPEADLAVEAAEDLRAWGWEPGLRMAVDNLLTNALVHGRGPDAAGRVEVRLRRSGQAGPPSAVLTVDDRGPGVPPAERERVFERFHRRPGSPGSGLGLTLIAQQVHLHRGTVRVLDAPGGGSRFEVRLPLLPSPDDTRTLELPLRRDWLAGTTAGLPA